MNLKTKDIIINRRAVDGMRSSSDYEARAFYEDYATVLEEMGVGAGEVVGFLEPIVPDAQKIPFPCTVAWSNSQMYTATDDIEQCVKIWIEIDFDNYSNVLYSHNSNQINNIPMPVILTTPNLDRMPLSLTRFW